MAYALADMEKFGIFLCTCLGTKCNARADLCACAVHGQLYRSALSFAGRMGDDMGGLRSRGRGSGNDGELHEPATEVTSDSNEALNHAESDETCLRQRADRP